MIKSNAILLLATALLSYCPSGKGSGEFAELTGFGDNPGNLRVFAYVPEGLSANAPLVVVLHGCLQDAAETARQSGWNELADKYGFLVLYPQQQPSNNLNNCFNWFVPEDKHRGSGEALSIRQTVAYAVQQFKLDERRIYISGISAGGAMAAVMMATYPEVFRAGAVMAGIPYGAAADMATGFQAMRGEIVLDGDTWEARVRDQYPAYEGKYPALAIFHGADDAVVSFVNAEELSKQWAALLDLDAETPATTDTWEQNDKVKRSAYKDSAGTTVLLQYALDSLGHAIAIDPGDGPRQGGAAGPFAKDIDFYAPYWAAVFFGLVKEE
ncbi:MAG: PHB depolymerase family esterase [Lewinellaceae bacterium]|nr:PHB depolymerase family esterase [Lewinellaceae bacterium]